MEVWALQLFNGLSLSSIMLLIALGLALSFGLMNVINLAHGEFIMLGAYTVYALQQVAERLTGDVSPSATFIIALPLSFAVAAGVGMLVEACLIRFLYRRPLDTLLATVGVGIFLQQLARSIFGGPQRAGGSPLLAQRRAGPNRRPGPADQAVVYYRTGGGVYSRTLLVHVPDQPGPPDQGGDAEPRDGFQPGGFHPAGGQFHLCLGLGPGGTGRLRPHADRARWTVL